MSEELYSPVGKEKEHYITLENLYKFSSGGLLDPKQLYTQLKETIEDFDKMMGGSTELLRFSEGYLKAVGENNRLIASDLYLFLSPLLFFVHALHEISRKSWRDAVTKCGIFCERIARNIFQEIDRLFSTKIWAEMSPKTVDFESKNGRLKKELESRHFPYADDLYGSMKRIYNVRNIRGPHDVPPPEPIQAKISINECLPTYMDYLNALIYLGIGSLESHYNDFLSIFSGTTLLTPAIVFGQETELPTASDFIKNGLYKQSFFSQGKTFKQTVERLRELRHTWRDSVVANSLRQLSQGKDAILTRRKQGTIYYYYERIPPSEYFKTSL